MDCRACSEVEGETGTGGFRFSTHAADPGSNTRATGRDPLPQLTPERILTYGLSPRAQPAGARRFNAP